MNIDKDISLCLGNHSCACGEDLDLHTPTDECTEILHQAQKNMHFPNAIDGVAGAGDPWPDHVVHAVYAKDDRATLPQSILDTLDRHEATLK